MNRDISICEENLLHVYNRFQVVFDHGEGMYLYDADGKAYLDFAAGIGVNALGNANPAFTEALKEQVDKLLHVSNLYYHTSLPKAAQLLCKMSKMDKAFFTNSGAEAIEGALKAAKKHAYLEGRAGQEIIAMESSFHGRTVGSLSVTGNDHYREPFYPLMEGVKFAKFNDLTSVEALVTDKTCAIILEPVQGEGGIIPGDEAFLKGVRRLCDEKGMVLIFDEVQCGLCRTGYPYVWQAYDVRPDILVTAKALGNGIPVGAFLVTEELSKSTLVPGDHGTTYGGNPLAAKAVATSLELMEKLDICSHVKKMTPVLEAALDRLVEKSGKVLGRRGMGFMQGLIVDPAYPVGDILKACLDAGLIVLSAGGNVIRLLPPLIAEKEDIEKLEEILGKVLE